MIFSSGCGCVSLMCGDFVVVVVGSVPGTTVEPGSLDVLLALEVTFNVSLFSVKDWSTVLVLFPLERINLYTM